MWTYLFGLSSLQGEWYFFEAQLLCGRRGSQGWRGPVRSGVGPVRPSLRASEMDQHPGETEKNWQGPDRPKHLRS